LAAAAIAVLVEAVTDEGVTWMVRLARALPALPLASAAGAAMAIRVLHTRGEVRALEALGRPPARSGLAAAVGATLVVAVVAGVVLGGPHAREAGLVSGQHAQGVGIVALGEGAFMDPEGTFRVLPGGEVILVPPRPPAAAASAGDPAPDAVVTAPARDAVVTMPAPDAVVTMPAPDAPSTPLRSDPRLRWMTALATVFAAAASALLATRPKGLGAIDLVATGAAAVGLALMFHAAAESRTGVHPLLAIGPAGGLFVWASVRSGRGLLGRRPLSE
jgi:hypothetical protein